MPLDQNEHEVAPVAIEQQYHTETVENHPEPTLESAETEAKTEAEGEKPEDKPAIPKGLQKRIDRLIREKHQMREELVSLRRAQEIANGGEQLQISREQFASEDDYLDAVIEQRQAKREAQQRAAKWEEKRNVVLESAEDSGVDLDVFAKLPVSRLMADAIVDSDSPVELLAYMTENPDEVRRIYGLSEARQAVEIGKIEARLSGESPTKTAKTAAPAPIKPVAGNGVSNGGYRPNMSFEAYAKWRGRKL